LLSQVQVTLLVTDALERLQIPYMVAGSLAAAAYGLSRSTQDADLVAQLRSGDVARLAAELGPEFYADVEVGEEAIRRRSSFSVIYFPMVFKVDIFVLASTVYDHQAFQRRMRKTLGLENPRPVFVESPEDLVLSKLKWYRLGGEVSELQWRDVLSVLKLQAKSLDDGYLRQWAEHERVLDLLDRAMREATPSGE